jgi:hypothetical protein
MSSWGKYDNAANTPLWAVNASICKAAPAQVHSAPTRANVTFLYANTTSGAYIAGETIGLFGVDAQEAGAAEKAANHVAHAGWVLKTVGSGGRAGRTQTETLVALSNLNGSDGDAQIFANVAITLALSTTAPSAYSNASYANTATVVVTPTLAGNTAATLTYQWQVNSAGSWTNAVNGTPANTNYSGATTATFGIKPKDTTSNTYKYRVIVTAADQGVTATSANVTMSVPA